MSRTRRDVLALMAALPLAALPARLSAAPETLRLLVHGRLGPEAAEGLQFGVAESAATASLLGRELQLGTSAAGITGAIGVIATERADRDDLPPDTPIVLIGDVPGFTAGPCTFRVAPSEAERKAALARRGREAPDAAAPSTAPRIAAWHPTLERYGAGELNDRYRKQTGRGMSGEAWLAWFTVKALVDSALRQPGVPPCQALVAARFDGHKGRPLRFDPDTRVLRQPLYVVDGDRVVGEILPEGT